LPAAPAKTGVDDDMDTKPTFTEHLVQREQRKFHVRNHASTGPALQA
jgi:hypothetical protein